MSENKQTGIEAAFAFLKSVVMEVEEDIEYTYDEYLRIVIDETDFGAIGGMIDHQTARGFIFWCWIDRRDPHEIAGILMKRLGLS